MVDLQSALRLVYPRDVLLEEEEEEEEEGAASCIASHLCLCRQLFLDQLQMVDPQLALRRVSPGPSRLGGCGEREIAAQSLPSEDLPSTTLSARAPSLVVGRRTQGSFGGTRDVADLSFPTCRWPSCCNLLH
jgi:hypothetical protein